MALGAEAYFRKIHSRCARDGILYGVISRIRDFTPMIGHSRHRAARHHDSYRRGRCFIWGRCCRRVAADHLTDSGRASNITASHAAMIRPLRRLRGPAKRDIQKTAMHAGLREYMQTLYARWPRHISARAAIADSMSATSFAARYRHE